MKFVLAALVAAFFVAPTAQAKVYFGSWQSHRATVYSGACDGQSSYFADGQRTFNADSGKIDDHIVASTFLPRHAHVEFARKVYGTKFWLVRDSGGAFDLYRPNCRWGRWDNPTLRFRIRYYR